MESVEGKGAVIQAKPDAPINLQNEEDITGAAKIGIKW